MAKHSDPPTPPDPYQRLKDLGLTLPDAPDPIGNFATCVLEGGLLYVSGQGPTYADGRVHAGKVGRDVAVAEAYQHARLTGLNLLAVIHEALGDLRRVRRIVKLLGIVNAAPDFADHPAVIDGCSDLMVSIFGEAGVHARSAVGFGSLPRRITVEIEAIVAVS